MEDVAEPTYVMLPPKHPDHAKGRCERVLKHMYGARVAADGRQQDCSEYTRSIGVVQGEASPCILTPLSREFMTVHRVRRARS